MKRAILAALAVMLCSRLAAQQQEMFVPQVIAGRDPASGLFLKTTFFLWNLSSEEVELQIDLFTNEGEPMNAFLFRTTLPPQTEYISSHDLTLSGNGAILADTATDWARPPEDVPFLVGWAKVTASGSVGLIVTVASIKIVQGTPEIITSTSLTPDSLTTSFSSFGLATADARTGLAILNPSANESCEVRVRSFDTLGFDKGEAVLNLAPNGKVVEFLNEEHFFPGVVFLRGKITVTASRPIAAVAIRVDGLNWSGFRLVGQ